MIEKAHKHSTVNAENVEIVTVAGNLNRSSAKKTRPNSGVFFFGGIEIQSGLEPERAGA